MDRFIEIDLENPPAGYVLKPAKEGEYSQIVYREFTSTEDGQYFIKRLEGWPDNILHTLPDEISPSQIDHMLAICHRDGKVHVCVNELEIIASVRAAGAIEAGTKVTKDHFADVERLELGLSIPDDAGFMFLFSVGWRKGLFYDLGPVSGSDTKPRQYDVGTILGQAYCHVLFQERFAISETEWNSFFETKWFPFIGLRHSTIDTLINHIQSGWDPDENLESIIYEIKNKLPQMLESWRNNSSFIPHISILERAVERFQNDDYISCTGLLFSRIEGLLRTHYTNLGIQTSPSSDTLTNSAVSSKIKNEKSLLLPRRFEEYLRNVYFANFDSTAQNIDVSRNSVGHGVADASQFNRKFAVIGILIVHQLFYFLGERGGRD